MSIPHSHLLTRIFPRALLLLRPGQTGPSTSTEGVWMTPRPSPPKNGAWNFYAEAAWKAKCAGTGTTGESVSNMDDQDEDPTDRMHSKKSWGFVENEAGKIVSESRIARIRAWVMHYIYELERTHGLDNMPPTWDHSAPLSWREELIARLEEAFPEVGFCDGHYKARLIIIAMYIQWKKTKKKQSKRLGLDQKKEPEGEDEIPSHSILNARSNTSSNARSNASSNAPSSVALGKRPADGPPAGDRAPKRTHKEPEAAPVFVDML